MNKYIKIVGASEHNLKNISINVPKEKLIVFTGLSGSGKSSLAFDTIYAEGQRRYVESLSSYARQFLEMMDKPKVESIEGLSPSISIEQKTTSKNPRSTVGTVTEIYDYLRVLYARVGIPYSPATGLPIEAQTVSDMIDQISKLKNDEKILILSPVAKEKKGEFQNEFQRIKKDGFQRVKVDGIFYKIDNLPKLTKSIKHDIDIVIDRLVTGNIDQTRLADSIETVLKYADSQIIIEFPDKPLKLTKKINISKNITHERIIFSTKFACPVSGFSLGEIEPRLFSFNSPIGACRGCDGLGSVYSADPKKIIPNPDISISDGAIKPWKNINSSLIFDTIQSIAISYNFNTNTPWKDLDSKVKELLLYGSKNENIEFSYTHENDKYSLNKPFEGIITSVNKAIKQVKSRYKYRELSRYQSLQTCKTCHGKRLSENALSVKINNTDISQLTAMSIKESINWVSNLHKKLSDNKKKIATPLIKEIHDRLTFLLEVGLDYLTLSRSSSTLSGGEAQRIRLASQIGSKLSGVIYVLDEPSIGLHQRDNGRLLKTLTTLRDLGNTVIVVEHDEEAICKADHIVDIGPGAGVNGGMIVSEGSLNKIKNTKASITGQYLNGELKIEIPKKRRKAKKSIKIIGANENNLVNINVEFPLGVFLCVTGVSGSGKSTLINNILYQSLDDKLSKMNQMPDNFQELIGYENIDKIIEINQSPIGRTPRSNPVTYTGTFTPIREWFANLPESKARGYKAGRFSFNVKGGRCENCEGDGVIKVEMHFLSDVYVTCDICNGKRYNRETLEVKYKNKSISDILDMTVFEAVDFFKAIPAIRDKLSMLQAVGLDYIKIGQSATTISGGEAQRIKLSKELSRKPKGNTLYILDEPTTGLHFHDVAKLINILSDLVERGNSVIVIEHNLDVIKSADWIIDMGPEGGDGGGKVIAKGRPEDLVNFEKSYTAGYLKKILNIST
ncbi:MAG: excinuclease ABC subunit UvrA [Hyphomicrobiales bacterium]|nr:excinuclease ABC subunit UvrA [Hyphomicrobiales bacterium]